MGPPEDVEYMASLFPAAPNIWTSRSWESINHLNVETAGSGALTQSPSGDGHSWEHCQVLDGTEEGSSRSFVPVPGPLQTVQRAEYWESSLHCRLSLGYTKVSITSMSSEGAAKLPDEGLDGIPLPPRIGTYFSGDLI